MLQLTLVLGGARSGKSRFALQLGQQYPGKKVFIATAEALDLEMAARIASHQKDRGPEWETLEIPYRLSEALSSLNSDVQFVLIDCLTLWLSNLLMKPSMDDDALDDAISDLMSTLMALKIPIVAVSNEVGLGIVPDNALSRRFRDFAGLLHQRYAAVAHSVVLMTAGLPQHLK